MEQLRKRAAVVQVDLDANGKPDLQLPPGAVYIEKGTRFVHLNWDDADGDSHTGVADLLGTVNGKRVYLLVGTVKILKGLQHLGAAVELLKDAWQNAQKRTWLMNHGIPEVNGFPRPRHVFAGDDPESIGKDE